MRDHMPNLDSYLDPDRYDGPVMPGHADHTEWNPDTEDVMDFPSLTLSCGRCDQLADYDSMFHLPSESVCQDCYLDRRDPVRDADRLFEGEEEDAA